MSLEFKIKCFFNIHHDWVYSMRKDENSPYYIDIRECVTCNKYQERTYYQAGSNVIYNRWKSKKKRR